MYVIYESATHLIFDLDFSLTFTYVCIYVLEFSHH